MPNRYFMEVSYKGTAYSGFQRQQNANSVQAEIEKAFAVLQKHTILLTGASRTDTGVHGLQNYFHFDYDGIIDPQFTYKMNAILPKDIVVSAVVPVASKAHCRFDAISRSYQYHIYQHKNPFLQDRAYHYPYALHPEKLHEAAKVLMQYTDFTSFSKRNTQVKSFKCTIAKSEWRIENNVLVYYVTANRFLRGMVRGLTGTMLLVGRGNISIDEFRAIITARDCSKANFSVPPQGLFLVSVKYPEDLLDPLIT